MLTPEQLKTLSQKSNVRPLLDIGLCWGLIAGSLYLTHQSLWWLPVSLPVITSRLHALTVMMHDGSHYLLHENRMVNDIISNVFCSFPLQLSTEAYRRTHNPHHQHTQTMNDPNYVIMQNNETWHFPKPKEEVKKILMRDLMLMTIKEHMIILKDWQVLPNWKKITKLEKVLFPLFAVTLIGATWSLGLWREFIILQVASLFINPLVRIRAMSEHVHMMQQGQGKIDKLIQTPTINANLIERFFIAPFSTHRHLEHHVYPSIPYFNLEKAHEIIRSTDLYRAHCRYELDGYFMGRRNSFNEVLCTQDVVHQIKKLAA